MPRKGFKNLIGFEFERLSVLSQAPTSARREIMWNCLCICGGKKTVRGFSLLNGDTKSCGCLHKDSVNKALFVDISGKKFNRLSVISRAKNDNHNNTMWNCICSCGKACVVCGNDLKTGHTKSCGCLNDEVRKRKGSYHPNYGRKATLETRKKMSLARIGFRHTKESIRKMQTLQCGPNHPNWKGGLTPEYRRVRNLSEYNEWRDSVFKRDNYTCQNCLTRGGALNAHHIKSFADYPELRLDINNGITYCEEHHREIHR